MGYVEMESLVAAPALISAFRTGSEEFERTVLRYASGRPRFAQDAAGQECLELLDHLVGQLLMPSSGKASGLEDACIFLLEHLAARSLEAKCVAAGAVIH